MGQMIQKPSIHDLVEVGQFSSFLAGEASYSYTPRSRLTKIIRRIRWFFLGAWMWLKVELGKA